MAEFKKCFELLDTEKRGVITIDDLRAYMKRMNYKESFLAKWIELFDPNHEGFITYETYCKTLGLIPRKHAKHQEISGGPSAEPSLPTSSLTDDSRLSERSGFTESEGNQNTQSEQIEKPQSKSSGRATHTSPSPVTFILSDSVTDDASVNKLITLTTKSQKSQSETLLVDDSFLPPTTDTFIGPLPKDTYRIPHTDDFYVTEKSTVPSYLVKQFNSNEFAPVISQPDENKKIKKNKKSLKQDKFSFDAFQLSPVEFPMSEEKHAPAVLTEHINFPQPVGQMTSIVLSGPKSHEKFGNVSLTPSKKESGKKHKKHVQSELMPSSDRNNFQEVVQTSSTTEQATSDLMKVNQLRSNPIENGTNLSDAYGKSDPSVYLEIERSQIVEKPVDNVQMIGLYSSCPIKQTSDISTEQVLSPIPNMTDDNKPVEYPETFDTIQVEQATKNNKSDISIVCSDKIEPFFICEEPESKKSTSKKQKKRSKSINERTTSGLRDKPESTYADVASKFELGRADELDRPQVNSQVELDTTDVTKSENVDLVDSRHEEIPGLQSFRETDEIQQFDGFPQLDEIQSVVRKLKKKQGKTKRTQIINENQIAPGMDNLENMAQIREPSDLVPAEVQQTCDVQSTSSTCSKELKGLRALVKRKKSGAMADEEKDHSKVSLVQEAETKPKERIVIEPEQLPEHVIKTFDASATMETSILPSKTMTLSSSSTGISSETTNFSEGRQLSRLKLNSAKSKSVKPISSSEDSPMAENGTEHPTKTVSKQVVEPVKTSVFRKPESFPDFPTKVPTLISQSETCNTLSWKTMKRPVSAVYPTKKELKRKIFTKKVVVIQKKSIKLNKDLRNVTADVVQSVVKQKTLKRKKSVEEIPETGRFPKAFAVQVGHRVPQHLRDGTPFKKARAMANRKMGTNDDQREVHTKKSTRTKWMVDKWHVRKSLEKRGVIVILLAGRHRGKRVISLGRQRSSGLLLVTGPFCYNGCPLRRVHPDYVIATKTYIDLSELQLPKHIHDKQYFARSKRSENLPDQAIEKLFNNRSGKKSNYMLTDQRKNDQKLIDTYVREQIKKHADSKLLIAYLKSLFSLGKHNRPHEMIF